MKTNYVGNFIAIEDHDYLYRVYRVNAMDDEGYYACTEVRGNQSLRIHSDEIFDLGYNGKLLIF